MRILIFIILPALLLAAEVVWEPVESFPVSELAEMYKSYPFPELGLTYMFWMERKERGDQQTLYFRIRYQNGTYSEQQIIATECLHSNKADMSTVQVTSDGMHILVAYSKYSDRKHTFDVYFTESLNGGKTWTEPAPMPKDGPEDFGNRVWPAIKLEEDTGRVIVASFHNKLAKVMLNIREPGKTTFNPEVMLTDFSNVSYLNLAYTIDKANSKRYIHLFWVRWLRDGLYYSKSADNGKTWSPERTLLEHAEFSQMPDVVSDPNVTEGGVFIQYKLKEDIKLHFTKDHGETWSSIRVGSDEKLRSSMAICGFNKNTKLFAINGRVILGNGYIRYQSLYERFFKNAVYPFKTLKKLGGVNINCKFDKRGICAISAIVHDETNRVVYFARGALKE